MRAVLAALVGLASAWAMTVPLYRFKEWRPKTPRDVSNEAGIDIRAVQRHARCPACRREQSAADVAPVRSWVRGCPTCGRRVPTTLILLQVGLPVAAAITAVVFDSVWVTVPYIWFAVVVAAVSVVDARIWLIPWWIPWVGSAVGAALMVAGSLALGEPAALRGSVIGALGAFGLFFVLWFVAPGRLGFGDVRLAFMIGLFLGWVSPLLAVWGLLLGSAVGVVVGVWSMVAKRGGHFAFGPALTIGAMLAVWLHPYLLV
jgi:leader peptidase (prepilin peptidase)/N-methyltransferase